MHGSIHIPDKADRATRYTALGPQVKALLQGESDLIAAMANLVAALREACDWHWIGFYRVQGSELVLGPFQGPVACSRIQFGKGVCGTAWKEQRTIIVNDVDEFPGHIACSDLSRSEIVVPVFGRERNVIAVLDVDSDRPADFGSEDAHALEGFCKLLQPPN